MRTAVVRGFGFKRTHLIEAPAAMFGTWQFSGKAFIGVATPLVGICKARLKSAQPCVVVMNEDRPTCPGCLTALENGKNPDGH